MKRRLQWRCGSMVRLVGALVIAHAPGQAIAGDWEVVTDANALRALMSDTTMEAALAGGAKATARYNADGTGELNAWGERFPDAGRSVRPANSASIMVTVPRA